MKPSELITNKVSLLDNIKNGWNRIEANNSLDSNETPQYDVEKLLERINADSLELVKVKVAIQAINMGLKSMDDLPEDALYPSIFMLQQMKEQKVKLNGVRTRGENVVLTRNKIERLVKVVDKEILDVTEKINTFNNKQEFKM